MTGAILQVLFMRSGLRFTVWMTVPYRLHEAFDADKDATLLQIQGVCRVSSIHETSEKAGRQTRIVKLEVEQTGLLVEVD